jgi:hypothetical protein
MTWLSEICDVNETRILPQFLDGERPPHAFQPLTSDIKQRCPSKQSWMVFSRFIRRQCNSKLEVAYPLGPWMSGKRNGVWPAYHRLRTVYVECGDTWQNYMRCTVGSETPVFHRNILCYCLPDDATPVIVHKMHDRLIIAYKGTVKSSEFPTTSLPSRNRIHEYLLLSKSCTDPTQEYGKFTILCAPVVLNEVFSGSENVVVVSDGSTITGTMTFGRVLAAHDGQRLASGSGQVPGYGTSHRDEAGRMLCDLRCVCHISVLWRGSSDPFLCGQSGNDQIMRQTSSISTSLRLNNAGD